MQKQTHINTHTVHIQRAVCLEADCVWDGRMREQLSALVQKQVLHTPEIYTHETEMACEYEPT